MGNRGILAPVAICKCSKEPLVLRKPAAQLFTADVLSQCRPRLCRKDVGLLDAVRPDLKIQSIAAFRDPIVPFALTTVSHLILVEGLQRLLEPTQTKPYAVHRRVLQNRRNVVEAIDHVANQRQNYHSVFIFTVAVTFPSLVCVQIKEKIVGVHRLPNHYVEIDSNKTWRSHDAGRLSLDLLR